MATPIAERLQRWLDEAGELEAAILSEQCIDAELVDAVGVALEQRRAHVRLVVDCIAPEHPRLRVRVVDRRGGWWLADSWGRDATRLKHMRAALTCLDVRRAAA